MTKRKTLQQEVAEVMATGTEQPAPMAAPSGNRTVTEADRKADREFVASLDETADGLGAVEADKPEATGTEVPETVDDATVDRPDAPQTEAKDQTGSPEPVARGGVKALVTRLLADPALSYTDIVEQVVATFPGAHTSARSVASTASVLRRKGTPVPMRRGPRD
jgi:hypothetical protein